MECFERFREAWAFKPAFTFAGRLLVISGREEVSTLKTSAPKSANVFEANGPGSSVEKSRIFNEESGAGILF